jgi:hypothetical protein
MSTSMIEQAFKTVFMVLSKDPDFSDALRKPLHWPHTQEAYRTLIRITIEAMREPTPAMVAATEAWCEADECDAQYLDTLGFVGVWEAMIDAALKETQDG